MNKFFLCSFLFLSIVAYSQDNKPIDWSADLKYLKVELPKNHYKLYHLKDESYFIRGIDKINASKDKASNLDIAIRLQNRCVNHVTFPLNHINRFLIQTFIFV